ncbi:isoprenylcysteine carboxylmethyltransferase family protein [Faecalicatena contorta]|uniref:methyltransferase family protein n=1 Tax=Faecalicatena contorta TaxID=39482 RepID=UPI0031E39E8E
MGIFLLVPFFLIRFGLLSILNKEAVRRAAFFAPLSAGEKGAYGVYQVSNVAILVYLIFLAVRRIPVWSFAVGAGVYLGGVILLLVSVVNFAAPAGNGMNTNGIYRISRNPMYVAYFVFFMGCVILTQSLLLLVFVLAFQISAHWIILSEERWCIQKFGEKYIQYMKSVRRYI